MGIGVGLVLGLADRSWSKAGRGALGGLVGGLIGGLLFDSFGALHTGPDRSRRPPQPALLYGLDYPAHGRPAGCKGKLGPYGPPADPLETAKQALDV